MTRPGGDPAWFCSPDPDGVRLRVRLNPNSGHDEIGSVTRLADGREVLVAKVRAIPEKGQANSALEKLISKAVGVATGNVQVVAGLKDRVKTVKIAGDGTKLTAVMELLPKKQ